MANYNAHRTSGSNEPFVLNGLDCPIYYHPYPTVRELRMDMREWTQYSKLIQQGTHFPLCITLGKIGTRSKAKQLERTPGTEEYKAKQGSKYPQGIPAHRSQQTKTYQKQIWQRKTATNETFSHRTSGCDRTSGCVYQDHV